MLLLVGTSNGWWNLGRKIKICLFVCLDNDMIIWWSSRYYDDPLYCDHLGSSQSSVSKPSLQVSLKARRHLCFSKLLAPWLLARVSYPKEIHHECPLRSFVVVNFSLSEKDCCLRPHLYIGGSPFGKHSLPGASDLKLKISMALCTHKSRMKTNKKEKWECLGREWGALIKFAWANDSQAKVWITFLFDELSRLTTV